MDLLFCEKNANFAFYKVESTFKASYRNPFKRLQIVYLVV